MNENMTMRPDIFRLDTLRPDTLSRTRQRMNKLEA